MKFKSMEFGKRLKRTTYFKEDEGAGATAGADQGGEENTGGADAGEEKTFSEAYVKSLRDENAKWRTKFREVEEKIAKFDGVDPEKYMELVDAQTKAQEEDAMKKGDFEKLREQLVDQHKKDLTAKEEEILNFKNDITSLTSELNSTILSNSIGTEASAAKAINPMDIQLRLLNEAKVELLENGQRAVRIYGDDGELRTNIKTGEPMSIKERIKEMKEDATTAHLFVGGTQGSGSGTTGAGHKVDISKMTPLERAAHQRKMMFENQ
jgi:hypothetical protein